MHWLRFRAGALAVLCAVALAGCAGEPPLPSPRSAAADVLLPREVLLIKGAVPAKTTLDVLLRDHGLGVEAVGQVIQAATRVFNPRRLRSQQSFELERTIAGELRRFDYEIDNDSLLRVSIADPSAGIVRADLVTIPKTVERGTAAAEVTSDSPSLFAAMSRAGEGADLIIGLAAIFAGELDFNSEVQLGDRFVVSFERFVRDGRPNTYGAIDAAEVWHDGKVTRAVRFTPPGGEPGYYDEQGRSLKRMFLKSPLKFEPRITSAFSLSRMHPVLHTARAHRGVDYGAPTGAPVVAVSSGTVISATFDNANGRMVKLRHTSGYQTAYLHLSRFATGIRAGGRVAQGDVIGYVGSTGLATGPHLHYALTKNGVYVNPVAEHQKMPPGEPVPAPSMAAFQAVRDQQLAELASAGKPPVVADATR